MPLNHRRSYLTEGVILVVLGLIAMALPAVAGVSTTRALGWLLLVGGAAGLIGTLAARHRVSRCSRECSSSGTRRPAY